MIFEHKIPFTIIKDNQLTKSERKMSDNKLKIVSRQITKLRLNFSNSFFCDKFHV